MNKYQKQALVDMAKIALLVLVSIAVVGFIIQAGVSAGDVVGALSLAAIGYCIYQLYLIRVGQLESEDKRAEMESRYK